MPQGYAPYGAPPSYPKSWMNILAFVTAMLCCGPVAVVFGHLGVAASNRGQAQFRGLGIAALVIGYFALFINIIWFINSASSNFFYY